MSVTTTADEKLTEAKDHIREAYKCLLDTINPDTWGSCEFKKEYIKTIHESITALAKIKMDLYS